MLGLEASVDMPRKKPRNCGGVNIRLVNILLGWWDGSLLQVTGSIQASASPLQ
jgi:hypothetical protein